jgi:hypothetical protein
MMKGTKWKNSFVFKARKNNFDESEKRSSDLEIWNCPSMCLKVDEGKKKIHKGNLCRVGRSQDLPRT